MIGLVGAIEGALALIGRASARLSARAGGIRFSNLQKQENQFRSELRSARHQAGAPNADLALLAARLQDLLVQVERLTGLLIAPPSDLIAPPGATAAPPTSSPISAHQAVGVRQGVTRAMIALASAPLHVRLEFGPGISDAHPDALLLAARVHAIHRRALGSLKQIRWESIDRAILSFGDADSPQRVEAVFDAQGTLQLPAAFHQNQGRAAVVPVTPAPPSRVAENRTPAKRTPAKPGREKRASEARRPASGDAGRGPERQPSGQAARRPSIEADRTRDGRPARPAGHRDPRPAGPRNPLNSTMADKLRAALGAASGPTPTREPSSDPRPVDAPAKVPDDKSGD